MKSVEVLLRENVPSLGKCGDVVKVAAGYARNYLMPRRIAVQATPENKRVMARRRAVLDQEEAARNAEIEARVAALSEIAIKTTQKADDTGRLYGSVSSARVAELLTEAGTATEEKAVRLDSPIKAIGDHRIKVHVHGDYFAEIRLTVDPEEADAEAEA